MKKLFHKHAATDGITTEVAEQMLHQVFDECGYEHNSVPLEALESYSNYRKERYSFQRTSIIVVLTLFLLLPFLFITATIYVAMQNEKTNTNPVYSVSVSGGIPVQKVTATIDGKNVPVLELSNHEYVLQPGINGNMSVSVVLINQQNATTEVTVEDVDSDPPVLVTTDFHDDDTLTLYFKDEGSGIASNGIIVMDEEGDQYDFTWDEETRGLTIPYPEVNMAVSVPDMKGNVLTVNLAPENDDDEDVEEAPDSAEQDENDEN